MPTTSRRSIHHVRLRNAQALACERDRWLSLRARINKLRTRELKNIVAGGGIQTRRDLCLSAEMDRMYEVREVRPLFFACGKKELSALMRSSCATGDDQTVAEASPTAPFDDGSPADLPRLMLPPGKDNPRQTPRRPGAPHAAPALINPLINAGRGSSC